MNKYSLMSIIPINCEKQLLKLLHKSIEREKAFPTKALCLQWVSWMRISIPRLI